MQKFNNRKTWNQAPKKKNLIKNRIFYFNTHIDWKNVGIYLKINAEYTL